jgi:hypothetical protein
MPLNDLSLEDLTEISGHLVTLETAGRDLVDAGLAPRFDLTPGEAVTITTSFRMPAIESPKIKTDWRYFEAEPEEDGLTLSLRAILDEASETPSTEAAPPEPAPEPVEPPAAVQSAGGTPSAAPSRSDDETPSPPGVAEATPPPLAKAASSEGAADSGGGQPVMAAATPSAASFRTASALAGGQPGSSFASPAWTPEEEARLIDLVVSGVTRLGLTKMAAIASAAQELGRGVEGVKSRCYNQLKSRLDAALAASQGHPPPPPEPTPSPEAAPTPADGDAAVGGHSSEPAPAPEPGAAVQPIANDLTGHLMALPDKGGWTLARDRELMDLSIMGWQPNEIGLELQVQANLVKARFDALTGLYEDANGKKVRRFTREAVFDALTRLVEADQAKGAA